MHAGQDQPPSGAPTDGGSGVAPGTESGSGRPAGDSGVPGSAAPAAFPPAPAGPALRAAGALYVPVRRGPAGSVVRLWRTPFGTRTAVAFTSDRRLRSVLGPTQPWIRLSEAALRRMAEPLGAMHLTVDPVLTARPPASWSAPDPAEALEPEGPPGPSAAAEAPAPEEQQPAGTAP